MAKKNPHLDAARKALSKVPVEKLMGLGRYMVVGGVPVPMYRGATSFVNLAIKYRGDDIEAARKAVNDFWDDCGGLMLALDLETGESI